MAAEPKKIKAGIKLLMPKQGDPEPVEIEADVAGIDEGATATIEIYAKGREADGQAVASVDGTVDAEGVVKVTWDCKFDEEQVPKPWRFIAKVKAEKDGKPYVKTLKGEMGVPKV